MHHKKIERSLYKLNKGIESVNHPSFVLALKTFIDMLAKQNIHNIEVPLLEVLNYGYHEITSEKEKIRFSNAWKDGVDDQELYDEEKALYDKMVDKQDFISKAKTEDLSNLIFRIKDQYDNIDIDVYDFLLKVKIKDNTYGEKCI